MDMRQNHVLWKIWRNIMRVVQCRTIFIFCGRYDKTPHNVEDMTQFMFFRMYKITLYFVQDMTNLSLVEGMTKHHTLCPKCHNIMFCARYDTIHICAKYKTIHVLWKVSYTIMCSARYYATLCFVKGICFL